MNFSGAAGWVSSPKAIWWLHDAGLCVYSPKSLRAVAGDGVVSVMGDSRVRIGLLISTWNRGTTDDRGDGGGLTAMEEALRKR